MTSAISDNQANRPWLGQYPSGVPHAIAEPPMTLTALLAEAVARYPDLLRAHPEITDLIE